MEVPGGRRPTRRSGLRGAVMSEGLALRATILLLPMVLAILGLWLLRDLWPPFRSVVVLFFLGWLVAFLLDPLVTRLTRWLPRMPRGVATAIAFLGVAALAVGLAVLVAASLMGSAADLLARRRAVTDQVVGSLEPIRGWAGSMGVALDTRGLVEEGLDMAGDQLGTLTDAAAPALLGMVGDALTIVFIGTVMVANKGEVLLFMRRLVTPSRLGLFDRFSAEVVRSFGGFIRGQFGLAALYGVVVALIAAVLGVPFAPIVGIATLLLQSIPWFGQLVSWIPLAVMTLAFRPELLTLVSVLMLAGWLALQNVIAPRVLGSAVGLHPLAVLAAVFLGGALAGPLGAVFGVPVAAALAAVFLAWLDIARPAAGVPPPTRRPHRRRGHGGSAGRAATTA